MSARLTLMVAVCIGLVAGVPLARADYYDEFSDGWWERDPNDPLYDANDPYWTDPNNAVTFDLDNPDWTIQETVGDAFAAAIIDGWLNIWAGTALFPFTFIGATVDDGSMDPNVSETFFDDSADHYIVAKMKTPFPDKGELVLPIHGNFFSWLTYAAGIELDGSKPFSISHVNGSSWSGKGWQDRPDLDAVGGFWIAFQLEGDGDPNNTWLRADAWNGEKFDWDGVWGSNVHPLTAWDPNNPERPYIPDGMSAVATVGSQQNESPDQCEAAFDQIECRWGNFSNVGRSLELIHKKPDYGTVTIDPDLLDDPNGDPNDQGLLRRYTDGTEVVLVATPAPDRGWQRWRIYDPNYPGDANYATDDTNTTLFLTMDQDTTVEAVFKCGSSVPPFVAMTLMALGLAVMLRRLS